MQRVINLAAFGLFTLTLSACVDEKACEQFTEPLDGKIEQLSFDLATVQAENRRLTTELDRLTDLYETPDSIDIESLAVSYHCLYVAEFNTPAFYDEEGNQWNQVSYDFAVVPVLEDHGAMVKSIVFPRTEAEVGTVVWFERTALTADYKQTASWKAGFEGEVVIALDNTDPIKCK